MTTYTQFTPNNISPFAFQPTLDGQIYAASVTWNLYGQRWYLNVNQQSGDLVFSRPLTGAPDGTGIQSITWSFGTATVVCAKPHKYTVGQTIDVTITGCVPVVFNGIVSAFIVDDTRFTYAIAANPGDVTQLGTQVYNLNLAGGYFTTSTLVFREASQTFEVTP